MIWGKRFDNLRKEKKNKKIKCFKYLGKVKHVTNDCDLDSISIIIISVTLRENFLVYLRDLWKICILSSLKADVFKPYTMNENLIDNSSRGQTLIKQKFHKNQESKHSDLIDEQPSSHQEAQELSKHTCISFLGSRSECIKQSGRGPGGQLSCNGMFTGNKQERCYIP